MDNPVVIKLYSKKPCVQCDASVRKLDSFKVTYEVLDATSEDNLDQIKELDPTYRQAPVMAIEVNGVTVDHWSGYVPDKITEWAAKTAPVGV